jgi:hypothetical protein
MVAKQQSPTAAVSCLFGLRVSHLQGSSGFVLFSRFSGKQMWLLFSKEMLLEQKSKHYLATVLTPLVLPQTMK